MPSSAALPDPASRLPAKAAFHSAVGETLAEFLPLPLDVKGRGVAPDALDRIEQRKRAAIEAEDYRAAAECHDLLTVLQPVTVGSELTLADASPPTLEGQRDFFRQFGFVVLRKVFAGDNLDRLVAAWRRVQRPAGPIWREQLRIQEQEAAEFDKTQRPDETAAEFYRRRSVAGKDRKIGRNFFDIAKDDLFAGLRDELRAGAHDSPPLGATLLDLLDPPRLVALLKALLGNELHMFAIQARTYPASSPASAAGSGFGTDADELRGYIGVCSTACPAASHYLGSEYHAVVAALCLPSVGSVGSVVLSFAVHVHSCFETGARLTLVLFAPSFGVLWLRG